MERYSILFNFFWLIIIFLFSIFIVFMLRFVLIIGVVFISYIYEFIVNFLNLFYINNDIDHKIIFGDNGNRIYNKESIDYYRDIPCNGNIFSIYWILCNFNIISKTKLNNGIISALILKWINEKKLCVTMDKNILVLKEYRFDFTKCFGFENDMEEELSKMFLEACDKDCILSERELKGWINKNSIFLSCWIDKVEDYGREMLILENKIKPIDKLVDQFDNVKILSYKVSNDLIEEAKKLYGLKKYLKDFTRIYEKQENAVILYEDYLIISCLLGMSKKVLKNLKRFNPMSTQFMLLTSSGLINYKFYENIKMRYEKVKKSISFYQKK